MEWIRVTEKLTGENGHITEGNAQFLETELARLKKDGIKTKVEEGILYREVSGDIDSIIDIAATRMGKRQIVRIDICTWDAVRSLMEVGNTVQAYNLLLRDGTLRHTMEVPWVPGTQMKIF